MKNVKAQSLKSPKLYFTLKRLGPDAEAPVLNVGRSAHLLKGLRHPRANPIKAATGLLPHGT